MRRRKVVRALPPPSAPTRYSTGPASCPSCHASLQVSHDGHLTISPSDIKERGDALRASIAFQLAGWLKGRFVRALLGERAVLHQQHLRAEQDIRALTHRLTQAEAPLKERLHAYETRIAELERELIRKGEVNRELIQAQIEAARKQLEAEKERNPSLWN